MPYLDTSLFKNATKMQIFGKIVKGNDLFTKTVSKKEKKPEQSRFQLTLLL